MIDRKYNIYFSLTFGLLLAFGYLTNAKAQDLDLYQKRSYLTADGHTLPYRVLYPQNYNRKKKYPLVLFLHGAGERGDDNEKQLVHGSKQFLTEQNRAQFPCFVLIPQCPADNYWASVAVGRDTQPLTLNFDYSRPPTWPSVAYMALVQDFVKKEKVDRRRLYIAGLSMGGMGTYETLHRHPDVFAAATPICGGADVAAYDARVKAIPFWVFHGASDSVVKAQYSRDIVEKLKALGVDVQYTEYPGVDHNSWDKAFAEPNYMEWIFSHSRKKKAKF